MDFIEYVTCLQDYLTREKEAREADIEALKEMTVDDLVELGYKIVDAKVTDFKDNIYTLSGGKNETRLRPGDKVQIEKTDATIVENVIDCIKLRMPETAKPLKIGLKYTIDVVDPLFYDPIINLYEKYKEEVAGSHFIDILSGNASPCETGLSSLSPIVCASMDEDQYKAVEQVVKNRPDIWCIIGPPGTGKTKVLAAIAHSYSEVNKRVLIIAHTHKAVDNALNKCAYEYDCKTAVKIGEPLKSEELKKEVAVYGRFNDYFNDLKARKKKNKRKGDIVGMTLQGAIVNIGLRGSGFKPDILIMDEASQVPISIGGTLGYLGAPTIVLIGDDKQMPPIFHSTLQDNPLSKSLFTKICRQYPENVSVLSTTYRMNDEITELVCQHFYQPYGIELKSAPSASSRRLSLPSHHSDKRIAIILSESNSLHVINVTTDNSCEDDNIDEANFAASLADEAIRLGVNTKDIAIITPFRKQVRTIREKALLLRPIEDIPLVDTVERLQGQDVEMIIISFCTSNPSYFKNNQDFLLNQNRLNVMLSRAKTKVVIIASDIVMDNLKWLKL